MNPALSFGGFVKKHRIALGLTQAELAARVGCATVTLRKVENDALRPSVQIAERLAMALNIPLEDRGEFVRLARTALLGTPEPPSVPTPSPRPEEIGGEDLSGRAVRGYELGERIGSGGFGAVYRAVQPGVEREVAVKIILPQYANHPDFIRRFEAEAHLVARLEHPHIVPLYDYWREPDAAYLVMRLLRGGCLTDPLKEGPLPLDFVLRILSQIGGALHTAHRFGVIHRDLKPANILLDEDGNAYLADFGIAKNLGSPNLEDQTQAGAFIGSPAYISPEQIRSESILPQADIYCLGVMLYELLAGRQPFQGPTPIDYIVQHLNQPLPPLAAHNPNAPAALDPIIQRATAKDPIDRYPDVPSLLAEVESALGPQGVQIRAARDQPDTENWDLAPDANPFKGLRPFGEADAEDFFGRNTVIQELLGRLAEVTDVSRFLAVVGPSGSGKSSVVKAGLIPAIRRGALPGSENWFVVDFMPGAHPMEELEAALLRIAVNPPDSLLGQLMEEPRGLVRAVKRILPADEAVELALVIDQFEEVFTLVQDEAARAHFLESLLAAVLDERSRIRVILTLRADFTDRPLQYVDFGELLRQRTEFILPLTPDEMEQAIAGPAERAGLLLEPGLTARIVRELGDQPGTLPLLQYALTELFERRDGRKLTLAAYQEIGGVLGALGRRAEEIYAGLDEPAQSAARQLFLRLVTLGEGVEDTRRRVLRAELASLMTDDWKLETGIAAYGKARLLSFDHDPVTRSPTVEVAHEALLREWPRLRTWLNESRADVRLQRVLSGAAAEWSAAGQDTGLLLRGTRLTQLDTWAKETSLALTAEERGFLEASLEGRKARQAAELERQERERGLEQRSWKFLRALVGVFALATIIAVFLSIFAFSQRSLAITEANARATQQVIAQEQANLAATSAANAQEQQAIAEEQAALAAEQQAIAETERDRAESEQRLATARELAAAAISNLTIDPERSILLALQAVSTTQFDGIVLPEAEDALHRAVEASHMVLNLLGDGWTMNVAYSPDGTRVATVGEDRDARIWDAVTGQELFAISGHTDSVRDVAFSPDGLQLATASFDQTAKIWNLASGELQMTLSGHTNQVWGVAFSPDGMQLATASIDGTAKVWDLSTGEELFTLSGHTGRVPSIAYSPDGTRLATTGWDGTVRVWNAASGAEMLTLSRGGPGPTSGIAFSPDGTRLAAGGWDNSIRIWDAATGSEIYTLRGHNNGITGIVFSPDGTRLATSSLDRRAIVWDLDIGQELFRLVGHTDQIWEVAFSPDGTRLVTGGREGTARIWDISPDQELFALSLGDAGYQVDFSPDGMRLAATTENSVASIWAISPSLTAERGISTVLLTLPDLVSRIAFSPDGTRLVTNSDSSMSAKVWDAETGELLSTLQGHTDFVSALETNSDGTLIATGSLDGVVIVWDATTGQPLHTLQDRSGFVWGLAFSPDGTRLGTAGQIENSDTPIIWDLSNGERLFALQGHTDHTNDIAFSPDGTRLATTSTDGTVRVWDSETGEELLTLLGHNGSTFDVEFSPDGLTLVTTGADGSAIIWDALTGDLLLQLSGSDYQILGISFSPDGRFLAAASLDGTVRGYVVHIEDLITLAYTRLTRWFTPEECLQYLHTETCPADIRP